MVSEGAVHGVLVLYSGRTSWEKEHVAKELLHFMMDRK
jgi:hypothetical protein